MEKFKKLLLMFLEMFKIGLFTFGGGYAMISMMESELVEKKKWIEHDEFMDLIAIAESTPGPLAINSATYIGYKVMGFMGSLFCTLGVVIPSFIIIFVISLFFDQFLGLMPVQWAFRGIQACVAFLILSAGLKMFKKLKKDVISMILFGCTFVVLIVLDLFALNFSTIFYILIGGVIGVFVYICKIIKQKRDKKRISEEQSLKEIVEEEGEQ